MKKEKINLTSIPTDAETTLVIGGAFYQRLNKLLIDYGDMLGKDKLLQSMYLIKNDRVPATDMFTFNLETIMILLKNLEQEFENSSATSSSEIEIEVPDNFGDNTDIYKDIIPD